MPLVNPLAPGSSAEVDRLAIFFNETLGFCPNSVLTMQRRPAIAAAFINLNKAVIAVRWQVRIALMPPRSTFEAAPQASIYDSDREPVCA